MNRLMALVKHFITRHPYFSVILLGLLSSLLGITIEYIINRDFIYQGIYGLIFYYIITLSQIKFKLSKKRKKYSFA